MRNPIARLLILSVAGSIFSGLLGETKRVASLNAYISGQVVSASSKPASSVWVILNAGSSQKGISLTGDDGRYYISGLENGTYTIMVRKKTTGANLFKGQIKLPQNRIYNVKIPLKPLIFR